MTYQDQLQTKEWKAKRNAILSRDQFKCRSCHCERTKFLGLSRSFGIKDLLKMKEAGYTVVKTNTPKIIKMLYKQVTVEAVFVGEPSHFEFNKLRFAQQWKAPESANPRALGSTEFICFLDDISEKQGFPDLNVHHTFYIRDKMAWDYPDEALVTLCAQCHQAAHEREEIPVYAFEGGLLYKAERCIRCSGSGYLPEFYYWQDGVCFTCSGHGVILR